LVEEHCVFTEKYVYIYIYSIKISNVIAVTVFELIIYAAHNLRRIKDTNANLVFMIVYYGHTTVSKATKFCRSKTFTIIIGVAVANPQKSLNPEQRSWAHLMHAMHCNHFVGALDVELGSHIQQKRINLPLQMSQLFVHSFLLFRFSWLLLAITA
jgi:hypothetical protein